MSIFLLSSNIVRHCLYSFDTPQLVNQRDSNIVYCYFESYILRLSLSLNFFSIPVEPPPYIDGVKINSPHYLCKIILGPASDRKYTIVVSQYEKSTTIYYTLRAYATCPFTLTKIKDPYKHEKQVRNFVTSTFFVI